MNEAERYALEKLEEAVQTLAMHPAEIATRVAEARRLLQDVDVDALTDAGVRELFAFIARSEAEDVNVAGAILRVRDLLQEKDVESDSEAADAD